LGELVTRADTIGALKFELDQRWAELTALEKNALMHSEEE
jgi:hypothetical protein